MQMRNTVRFLLLAGGLIGSTLAHATLVGVFIYRNVIDHIHVSVSDDASPHLGTMLNVWNQEHTRNTDLRSELQHAKKFVLFQNSKPVDQIVADWLPFHEEVLPKRSILNRNCAFATRHVLEKSLGIKLDHHLVFAHVASFVFSPTFGNHGIPLPDEIRLHLKASLKKNGIKFITEEDKKAGDPIVALLGKPLREALGADEVLPPQAILNH